MMQSHAVEMLATSSAMFPQSEFEHSALEFRDSLSLEDSPQRLDDSGPVFIMGCPRSGTTVLADCIGTLPNVISQIGILIPDRMMHLLGSGLVCPAIQEDLLWGQRYILWRWFLAEHVSRIAAVRDTIRKKKIRTLWRRGRSPAELVFAYKEPFLVFAAALFAEHFKKAKFIDIIRDGRDCADSMRRTYPHALVDDVLKNPFLSRLKGSEIGVASPWRGWLLPWWLPKGSEEEFVHLQPFSRTVCMWQVMVRKGQELARSLGPDRLLQIRYEELCRHPQEVGDRIQEFLGLSPSWAFRRILRSLSPCSIGCHRRQDQEVLREANRVGKPLLEELGYL